MFKLLTWAIIGYLAYQVFWKGQKRIDKKAKEMENDTIIDIDYEEVKD